MSNLLFAKGLCGHHSPTQLPEVTLPDLLNGVRTELPLQAIDGAMGRYGHARLSDIAATRRTHIDAARALLKRIHATTPPEQRALEYYTEHLAQASQKAPQKRIHKYVLEQLSMDKTLPAKVERIYQQLSPEARNALFLLLAEGAVPPKHLNRFLLSSTVQEIHGGRERVLNLVALLFHYGVENYGSAFIPSAKSTILHDRAGCVVATVIELEQALWLAAHTDALRVVLDRNLYFDWNDMTPSQRQFLNEDVLVKINRQYRDRLISSRHLQVDALVQRPSGVRLVEVKCCNGFDSQYREQKEAEYMGQILRYGLAVRHHQLEGIEYLIMARHIDRPLLRKIKRALSVTGVPYALRVINGKEKITGEGIDFPILDRPLATKRTRALPPIPPTPPLRSGTRNARPDPKQQSFSTQEDVRAYLATKWGIDTAS